MPSLAGRYLRLVESVEKVHKKVPGTQLCEFDALVWPCQTIQLVHALRTVMPVIHSVGSRVMAINYKGERLGKGRVTASQRENGPWMKVRLDTGGEIVVPQGTSKRLVQKT